jgi:hypothetical protein
MTSFTWQSIINVVALLPVNGLTKSSLDGGDSSLFSSIFLVLIFFWSQALSTRSPAHVTQAVGLI